MEENKTLKTKEVRNDCRKRGIPRGKIEKWDKEDEMGHMGKHYNEL